eukprot:TRINITY_DN23047_c0_g1_i1.p1 TRINITY_DN23047_c0_g1~~TRINITY_DN23047_c0_g1_i1.p1  ORF type:complete len:297 (+),score=46.13 TRINITY_DN23047_c0_g1_i1:109-999(+)
MNNNMTMIKSYLTTHPGKGLIMCLQMIFIAWCSYVLVMKFQMLDSQAVYTDFNNTICYPTADMPASDDPYSAPNICDLHYKFKKFVWFYCDGLARDLAEPILSLLGSTNHTSTVFRVKNEGFPASYAVFSSYVTGKIPANYLGAPIHNDNIMFQFQRAGMRMAYYGTKMPAYDVLHEGPYFEDVKIEYVEADKSTLYETMYSSCGSDDEHCTNLFLDHVRNADRSVVFSGDIVDERNHVTGDRLNARTLEIIAQYAQRMTYIKKWIDNNPEYLLIVMSDHGGKTLSETETHGKNDG